MDFKKFVSVLLISASLFLNTYAVKSVLGSTLVSGYTTQIGEGTRFTHNVFYSDQSGVGKQTENYIEYTPNDVVSPVLTNGNKIYGTKAMSAEYKRLQSSGLEIIAGSNADYFSLQTGVPMSNAIVDGKIISKDATGQDGIGIMPDGTAFVSYFYLNSVLIKEDGSEVNIYNINKYRQPYAAYMMTSDFSDKTHNTTEGIDVILNPINGEMKLGTQMKAVVEAVNEEKASATIPEGKIVITVDKKAPKEFFEPISSLQVGEEVTLSFSATGDPRWKDVAVGMGSVGGRLLINGEVNQNLEAGAAPRTAIGIKKDGSIVLYTIDGRQAGYSYGVQLRTLAKRMKELGCVEALNLDGGGSTQMMVQLPGYEDASTINKPSDGGERKVSTFLFFANKAKKTGVADTLHIYPKNNYLLVGAKTTLSVKATDEAYYPATIRSDIQFSVDEDKESTVTDSGVFTAKDDGTVTVYVKSGNLEASLDIECYRTPTDIRIKRTDSGEYVTKLKVEPETELSMVAEAYGGYNKLIAENNNFIWQADNQIGTISSNGKFKATSKYGASGYITVTAGEKSVKIAVETVNPEVNDPNSYPDIKISAENGMFKALLTSVYDIDIKKEGITVKIDGNPIEFNYDEETHTVMGELPENAGKITIFATNVLGCTSFKSFETENVAEKAPFLDTEGHWAEDILGYMYSERIINGDNTDGTLKFNPQKPMTRAEFAVMMTNYLRLDGKDYESVVLPYSDIDDIPFWALGSFKALYKEGILKGRYVSETESCADALSTISRAEAATIVARVLPEGILKKEAIAVDSDDIPFWAKDGFEILISTGTIKGYEDGRLNPLNTLTKAEAAKILYSIM